MIAWLKRGGLAVLAAAGAFLAFMAAAKATARRNEAREWQDLATELESEDVADRMRDANAALTQAKFHAAEAERIAHKAEARLDKLAKSDETMADIVDRWRAG